MLTRNLLLCLPVLLCSACATTGSSPTTAATQCPPLPQPEVVVRTKVIDTFCDENSPIILSVHDLLVDKSAQQIGAYNEKGVKKCGWKGAPSK